MPYKDKEKRKECNKRYYQKHKKEINKKQHEYYLKNSGKLLKRQKQQRQKYPEKQRELHRKDHSKYRGLDFNPLNEPFKGCVAHHINTKDVIYIPNEMHRSIPHCLNTRQGMAEINTLAIRFYLKQLQEAIK